ncbi:MAG: hypothetical protein WA931_06715, partial [Rhodococcus sp. (in: high G+C Gram-positive bacteria)]
MTGRDSISRDVLADLHGGLVPEDRAPQLWEQALADPSAAAYLDELDATVTALRSRGADHQATAS